ncbi:ATP-binding protein, partial [Acinetobacter baumannii]
EQSGVTVAFTPAADDPVVMGNEVQLQQVVMNLVINALEALADNAPGNRNLRIGVSRHDGCARITVSDNGPGIRPDLADTLFAPLVTS